MSNLLEQAIIDATALREVALKSAEANLIEKYSKEFKESVQKLLEQETAQPTADVPAVDPTVAGGMPTMDMGGEEKEEAFKQVPSSFLSGDENELVSIDFKQLKKEIESAMGVKESPLLTTPDQAAEELPTEQPAQMNEELAGESNWSEEELEEEYEQSESDDRGANSSFMTDALDGGVGSQELFEVEEDMLVKRPRRSNGDTMPREEEEEWELEENAATPELTSQEKQQLVQTVGKKNPNLFQKLMALLGSEEVAGAISMSPLEEEGEFELEEGAEEQPMEENIQISEEELNELMEELKVDINIDNLSDGHSGTTVTQKREQRNMEMAASRDSKEVEKREQESKEMADLKKELQESLSSIESLLKENEELEEKIGEMSEFLGTLKENVEKLSISNAKLLYTNKVLGNVSLNERQKEQIVETISKSTSVLEAKTIYNTLQSTVSGVSSKKNSKESLSEALIRGNSPFLNRKQQTADLPFADRMKKLAGITTES